MLIFAFSIILLNFYMIVAYAKNQSAYGMGKLIFSTMMLILWIFSNIIMAITADVYMVELFFYCQYVFLFMFVYFLCIFAYEFSSLKNIKVSIIAALTIIPIALSICFLVPELRVHFIYYTVENPTSIDIKLFKYTSNYSIAAGFVYLVGFIMSLKFYFEFKKSFLVVKNKMWIIVVGVVATLLYNFLATKGYINSKIDATPLLISLTLTAGHIILNSLTFNTLKTQVVENIMNEIDNIILSYDNDGLIIFLNEKTKKIFNLDENKVLGINVMDTDKMITYFPHNFVKCLMDTDTIFEINNEKYKNVSKPILKGNKSIGTLVNFIDITDETNYNEQLVVISNTDVLTNLKNRYAFETDTKKIQIEKYENISLITIDLDNLKITNDVLGHSYGDESLKKVSEFLQKTFTENVLGIYRLGGDEFCVILENYTEDKIREKLLGFYSLASNHNLNNVGQILFSVGCASKSIIANTMEKLYKFSDVSLYKSKEDGKNKFTFFTLEIYEQFIFDSELKDDLIKGVQNNEITMFLQPKFNLKNNSFDSAEALVRWNHSEKGLIPPIHFLDLASNLKIISELDFIVLDKSCQLLEKWKNKYGKSIDISVNLSLESLIKPTLYEDVTNIIKKYNINPENITFEILENKLISDLAGIRNVIVQLKNYKVKFAIDDFGTGFSNFDLINNINVDYIKLDKSLIDNICISDKYSDNLELICKLLKNFESEIVAEGVETIDQLNILKTYNVEYIQGYYFSKPISIEDFEKKYITL